MIRKAVNLLSERGLSYLWYLITGVALNRIGYHIHTHYPRLFSTRVRWIWALVICIGLIPFFRMVGMRTEVAVGIAATVALLWLGLVVIRAGRGMGLSPKDQAKVADPRVPSSFVRWEDWLSGEVMGEELLSAVSHATKSEVVLGRIDNDGRLFGNFGAMPGFKMVSGSEFNERYRYDLDLVLLDGLVLVRKNFRRDRSAFRREWSALTALGPTVKAPSVHSVNENQLVLYKSFVPGVTLRDRLVGGGAEILTHQTVEDPELTKLAQDDRIATVWKRGRDVLDRSGNKGLLKSIEKEMNLAHRQGVTGFSLTFGNIVIHDDTGEPWLIDFDRATTHSAPAGMRFCLRRDFDRSLFNRIFGSSLLTETVARSILRNQGSRYSPVDLGRGLVTPGFWSIDSGTGRWQYLNGRVLSGLIEGRRVLDLGSNNGALSLMMLRSGAKSVVGLEISRDEIRRAKELHELFEWNDLQEYDFEIRSSDIRAVVSEDLGGFDVVTAFCSLYYLEEEEMADVARAVHDMAPIFVVQAKTDTRPDAAAGKAKKSSVEYLRSLLRESGFEATEVHGPVGYSRPLIIGRST